MPAKRASAVTAGARAIDSNYELGDRYDRTEGRVFLTGVQALVRIVFDQARLDRAEGRRTAGFVSGYRGSPLGGVDQELWRQKRRLDAHDIRFEPGINEDLGATMLWGTQQIDAFPGKRVDGVFGLWYGKGPGVDRTADVFRNANVMGTSAMGGVLAVAGDDHAAQSSTFPHQTDQVFEGAMMPILQPADLEDYLSFGLRGIALSRFSGLWVGFKAIAETVESGQVVRLEPSPRFRTPVDFEPPPHGLSYDPSLQLPAQRAELERRLVLERLPAAVAFARVNSFDATRFGARDATIGLVTVGKAHHDTIRALRQMAMPNERAESSGIALHKIGLVWPIDQEAIRRFARGKRVLFVIEEKRAFVEAQIRQALYNLSASERPVIVGKTLVTDEPLLPAIMEFSPQMLASALSRVLADAGLEVPKPRSHAAAPSAAANLSGLLTRKPFFCSGCPHNTSTNVPEGSFAAGGIGCHILAISEARRTRTHSHMGGEGIPWVGLSSFTTMPHLFVNLGDGTYQHSGILAIRQAVAAKARVTYKILFNDAVAMTGGQPPEGAPSVGSIARQVAAEGVTRIALVSDDPDRHVDRSLLPAGIDIQHRDRLDAVQRALRDYEGVSVIIYDQTCAAEKRRRRRRKEMADPDVRIAINARVCEGCGDCSVQSNCIAVEPLETLFGRKRVINQSACNKDISCVKGFCPSFVTISGATPRKPDKAEGEAFDARFGDDLPEPSQRGLEDGQRYSILVTGIGGTGVVTVGSVIAMAAHLEGRAVRMLDFTGVAQKNGAVVSHVQIADSDEEADVARVPAGELDLLIASDLVAATSPDCRSCYATDRTSVVGNLDLAPPGDFVADPGLALDVQRHRRLIEQTTLAGAGSYLRATTLANRLFGDAIAANFLLVGVALQKGLLPVSEAALLRAIELNGVSVELNKTAFHRGRLFAAHPEGIDLILNGRAKAPPTTSIDDLVATFSSELVAYQSRTYADRYLRLVEAVRDREVELFGGVGKLTETVARAYHKVLAYKDEYEVARLYSDRSFLEGLQSQFAGDLRLTFHMAPPVLARWDPQTGRRRKIALSGRVLAPMLKLMRYGKVLRSTWLDPFRYQADRVQERQSIRDFESDAELVLKRLDAGKADVCIELLAWPLETRGYGPIKEASRAAIEPKRQARRAALQSQPQLQAAQQSAAS